MRETVIPAFSPSRRLRRPCLQTLELMMGPMRKICLHHRFAAKASLVLLRRVSLGMAALFLLALLAGEARADGSGLDLGPIQIKGDEPSYGDLGLGAFNIQRHRESPTDGEGHIELRYGRKLFYLGPALGFLGDTRGGFFGYGGFYSDVALGPFVLTGLAGAGGYDRGSSADSIDLGGTFEFRLSADLAYEFDDESRFGVQFAHISNAGLHDRNPGENELLLTYAVPLRFSF
jgi:lipid A 3-O-deacylase